MTDTDVKALKHYRAVLRESLDLPYDVVEKAAKEVLAKLHELSSAFAGPIPAGDRGLYKAWALKREAFEYTVLQVMGRASIAGKKI